MRVLLLVSDSRPAGKSGGRAHFSPGFVDVEEQLAKEWIAASLALDVRTDSVHAPAGSTLCTAHASEGRSCTLLAGHKGGRHYDFSGLGKKGEDVGAGWWNGDEAIGATVTFPPSTKPCPTVGCEVGPLGHGGGCVIATKVVEPAPVAEALATPSVDAESEMPEPRRKGKG